MPERWEREVRRIRSVEPSDGLWQRAGAGPTHPRIPPGPGRRSRLIASLVSLALVVIAGIGLWNAFGQTGAVAPGAGSRLGTAEPPTGPMATPSAYFVTLPDTVTARTGGSRTQLVVTVRATTNMPAGAHALVWYTYRGGAEDGGGGGTASAIVRHGEVNIDVPWGACDFGDGFSLSVEFRPFYEDFRVPGYPQGLPWPPTQPQDVLRVLGARFEHVSGDQVTTVGSSKGPIRQIRVSRRYVWPSTPSDFIPPPCPAPTGSP